MLDDKSHEIDVEQDLGGIELFPADRIPEDFYEQQPPSVKIIHIIIQPQLVNGLGGTMLPYSADHKTFESISLNNPDISYRSKVVFSLVKDLIEEKDYKSFNALGSIVGIDCSWETFGDVWRRIIGVSWIEWIGQCQHVPTILILDEIQLIYKQKCGIDENKKLSADAFWKT
ncbi:16473_t:CDS:2, partial [Racocetra persica]